jgi:hypothetical protein
MNKSTYKCASPEYEKPQKGGILRSRPSVLSAVSSRGYAPTATPWMRPHRGKSQIGLSRDTWSSPPFVHAILRPIPWYWVKGYQLFVEALDSIPEYKV